MLSMPCLIPESSCTIPQTSENIINSPIPAIKKTMFSVAMLAIIKITRPITLKTSMTVAYVYQPLRSTYLDVRVSAFGSNDSEVVSFPLFKGVPQNGHFSNWSLTSFPHSLFGQNTVLIFILFFCALTTPVEQISIKEAWSRVPLLRVEAVRIALICRNGNSPR